MVGVRNGGEKFSSCRIFSGNFAYFSSTTSFTFALLLTFLARAANFRVELVSSKLLRDGEMVHIIAILAFPVRFYFIFFVNEGSKMSRGTEFFLNNTNITNQLPHVDENIVVAVRMRPLSASEKSIGNGKRIIKKKK